MQTEIDEKQEEITVIASANAIMNLKKNFHDYSQKKTYPRTMMIKAVNTPDIWMNGSESMINIDRKKRKFQKPIANGTM